MEERIRRRVRLAEKECALSEVVQQQGWEPQSKPSESNGASPEMPHVGVQRLRTRHRQHDRAQRQECDMAVRQEERDAMPRVERAEDARLAHDFSQSEDGDR